MGGTGGDEAEGMEEWGGLSGEGRDGAAPCFLGKSWGNGRSQGEPCPLPGAPTRPAPDRPAPPQPGLLGVTLEPGCLLSPVHRNKR